MEKENGASLITVGITAYNAEETIALAVNSALDQDWPNFEIVVVDDVSTDDTMAVLKELTQAFENLRIFTQEKNKGVAASRNRIIKEAQGEFIVFFDDDDKSEPDRLTKQYQRITKYERAFANEAPVLCHTARNQIFPDRRKAVAITAGCVENKTAPHGTDMLKRLLWGKPCPNCFGAMPTCSQMARRSVYEALGGFDEELRRSEDTELNIRHAATGGHFIGIAEPLVTQKMTMSSDKLLSDELNCTLYYLNKHREHFPSNGAYKFQKRWIKAKYAYFAGKKAPLIKAILRHPFRSFQKILWALPSYQTNKQYKSFYKSEDE